MAPSAKQASQKVVTANKILTSVIPGFSTLVPNGYDAASNNEIPTKAKLLDNLENDVLWYSHIKSAKNTLDLEDACRNAPKYWKTHYRHALWYITREKSREAYEVFLDTFKEIDDYDIRMCFLKFLYHTGSIHEYVAAVHEAVDRVGVDFRSEVLWLELVTILTKIYNCSITAQGLNSAYLPSLFSVSGLSTKSVLTPSQTEHMAFCGVNTLDKSGRTYIQIYGEVNNLRKLLHRWLRTPTNNMQNVWAAYGIFEKTVSSVVTLESKLTAEQKPIYEAAVKTYQKLCDLYAWVYPAKPVRFSSTEYSADALHYWTEIIKFEESNPIGLTDAELFHRVAYTFNMALVSLYNCNKMWFMYFEFLKVHDKTEFATFALKHALELYIPNDEKLRFILVSHFSESGDVEAASQEYRKILFPAESRESTTEGTKPKKDAKDIGGELKLRNILQDDSGVSFGNIKPSNIIHYLNFVRRTKGRIEWQQETDVIISKRELQSWPLAWYTAHVHLRAFKNMDAATSTLKNAQATLPFDLHYTILHLNLLLDLGKIVEARILASDLVQANNTPNGSSNGGVAGGHSATSRLSQEDVATIWNWWINAEYYYGTMEQYQQVMETCTSVRVANQVGMDAYTEKPRKKIKAEPCPIFTSVGDMFMRRNFDATKRQTGVNFNAIVEAQKKLFCAGMEFEQLDAIFTHYDGTSSKLGKGTRVAQDLKKDAGKPGLATDADDANVSSEAAANVALPNDKRPAGSRFKTRIVRPDITQLSPVDPTTLDSLESLVIFHGSKRPQLPVPARPLDSMATPPKCLYDLLRLLPNVHHKENSVFPTMYATPECIDYLIRSLESLDTSNIPLDLYEPLPVDKLLFIKATSDPPEEHEDAVKKDVIEVAGTAAAQSTQASSGVQQRLYSVLRFLEDNAKDYKGSSVHMNGPSAKRQKVAI